MIRLAAPEDAAALSTLNEAFNGENLATPAEIEASLRHNPQEKVLVAEEDGVLVGFLCLQLKKSFCYREILPEITELYVAPAHRRQGIARQLMAGAEAYCRAHMTFQRLDVLTGDDNAPALALYRTLGYCPDGEVHLSKEMG